MKLLRSLTSGYAPQLEGVLFRMAITNMILLKLKAENNGIQVGTLLTWQETPYKCTMDSAVIN